MAPTPSQSRLTVDRILRHERAFVLAVGGYAVELAGAHLVVHERLPAPRFNFVQIQGVPPMRGAAFFERALDHYFQRAIRPSFRAPSPVPDHLDRGLRRFGFRPREEPHIVLVARSVSPRSTQEFEVRPIGPEELDLVTDFWTTHGSREEFRRSIEVAWNFPHVGEAMEPLIALRRTGLPATAALLYRNHDVAGIHAIATQPNVRGLGAASTLVCAAVARPIARDADFVCVGVDDRRAAQRLTTLGFEELVREAEYELAPDAELALPPLGPPGPPRWRPPRHRSNSA